MSVRRSATVLLVSAAIAGVAACSSSGSAPSAPASGAPAAMSAAAYRQALHAVAVNEAAAQRRVGAAFHATRITQVRVALSTFAADQATTAQHLNALHPPSDAVAANAALAKAFSDNAAAINDVLARIATAKTVQQALRTIQSDHSAQQVGHEIDAALAQLKKLGYTSGS